MKYIKLFILALFSIFLVCIQPVISYSRLPHSTVLDGSGILTRGSNLYNISKGSKLYEGDILNISNRLQFIAPYGAFTITKGSGLFKMILQRRESCGLRFQGAYTGRISTNARNRTCLDTIGIIESITTGASFYIWGNIPQARLIPNTLIAQNLSQGLISTSFNILEKNNKSYLEVKSGNINVQNENKKITVKSNQGNITDKDKPPSYPFKLNDNLDIKTIKFIKMPRGLLITGNINPLNILIIQNKEYKIGDVIPFPIVSNTLKVGIKDIISEKIKYYNYPLPSRKI